MACSGFGTPPPKLPECRSISGPVMSICASNRPRMPTHMDGTSAAHIEVSVMTITSQDSRSRSRRSRSGRCGEPDSSSPSTSSLRVTGGAERGGRPAARQARSPRSWNRTWPLSSEAPRARIWPSRSAGWNGGLSPLLERLDRLHVVVAVDEHDRSGRVVGPPLGEHRGQALAAAPSCCRCPRPRRRGIRSRAAWPPAIRRTAGRHRAGPGRPRWPGWPATPSAHRSSRASSPRCSRARPCR